MAKVEAAGACKERRKRLGYTVAELTELVRGGLESGPSSRTMEDVKAETRRRLAAVRRE